MANVDGFVDKIYVHKYEDAWPTMGDLVEQNTRIIVFYFNGGTCTDGTCPRGFEYFYNYASETQFESESLEDLENDEYSCEITRGPQDDALPANFLVVNNFVTPPDADTSAIANSQSFLADRLNTCANIAKMRPNFVYLDFWSQGVTAQVSTLYLYIITEFAVLSNLSSHTKKNPSLHSWCNMQMYSILRSCFPNYSEFSSRNVLVV